MKWWENSVAWKKCIKNTENGSGTAQKDGAEWVKIEKKKGGWNIKVSTIVWTWGRSNNSGGRGDKEENGDFGPNHFSKELINKMWRISRWLNDLRPWCVDYKEMGSSRGSIEDCSWPG